MGGNIDKNDHAAIVNLAKIVRSLINEQEHLESYIEKTMQAHCPNFTALAGSVIGGRLLRGAGSLKNLAMMRASTIQLLGAERALFRHIKTGAKPPKFGFIAQHKLVQNAKTSEKGKVARTIADKLFILARVDYFKGEFIGDKMTQELEVRFS